MRFRGLSELIMSTVVLALPYLWWVVWEAKKHQIPSELKFVLLMIIGSLLATAVVVFINLR
jgi:hypothetical protein